MIRFFVVLISAVLLSACNTVSPHLDVYTGLVPPGYQIKPSRARFNPASLRHKTVAIVTTQNFETYTKTWVDYYERGGAERKQQNMSFIAGALSMGSNSAPIGTGMSQGLKNFDQNVAGTRQASDPRQLKDQVMAVMKRRFRKVIVATDFADAHDKRADYIALVDYHFTANAMGDAFSSWSGVYLLDSRGHLVLQEASTATVARGGDITGANTIVRVLHATMDPVMARVARDFGMRPVRTQ